jgi:GT2 family glycosyltransferase
MYDIVLLILNYNNAKDTIELCNSLINQKDIKFKILVVDNCSPDNSHETIKDKLKENSLVEIIKSTTNGGYAKGNNVGLRYIEKNLGTKYVAILNNDLIISDEYLFSSLIKRYNNLNNPAFITPTQKDENNNIIENSAWKKPTFVQDCLNSFWIYRKYLQSNRYNTNKSTSEIEVEILPGCFLLTEFDYFKQLEYFDEGTFLFLEERIILEKVQKTTRKNYLINDLFYYHESSSTIEKELSNIFKYKVLYESLMYYTKNYRTKSTFNITLLNLLLKYSLIELRLIDLIKKNIK